MTARPTSASARPDERSRPVGPQLRLLLAFAWTSVLNYGFGLAASRLLDPGDFGLLAFAQSMLLLAGFVLQSGVPWTLTRDVVAADPERRASIVRGALVANLGIAAILAVVLVVLYAAGPLQTGLESLPALAAVIAALPLISVAAVWRATSQGLGAYGRVGLIQGVEVTGKTLVGLALAAGFGAVGAIAGFTAGGLFAALVGLVVVLRLLPRRPAGFTWPRLAVVGPMFGALLALALLLNLDLVAMKLLSADREATGHYQAAIILANAPYVLVSAAFVPVLFTRLASATDLAATRSRVAEALRFAFALILPMELVLIAIPDVVLAWLFPPAYAVAAPIVRLMAVGNSFLMLVAVIGAAHQGVGHSGVVGRILLVIAGAEAVALLWLVPRYGALGAVVAFDAAALVAAVALSVRYVRHAGVLRSETLRWTGRWAVALLAGGAVASVAFAAGGVPVALVASAAVYYGLVLALRLVPEMDPSGLATRLRGFGHRTARPVTAGPRPAHEEP